MFNLELINYGNQLETTINVSAYVSQPIESLRYSRYIDDRSIALEYIDTEEVNSKDNLHIQDLSWRIPKNNLNFFDPTIEVELQGQSFFSEYSTILITNKIAVAKQNQITPLYYRHKRKVKEASVHCVKIGDGFDVEYGLLIEDNCIYTNYSNYFDPSTGKHQLYFVNGIDIDGKTFNELLDPVPIITEESWEDVDLDTGEVAFNTYKKIADGDGYLYTLNLSTATCNDSSTTSASVFVKNVEANTIRLLPPESYSLNESWNLRVQNGRIVQNGRTYKIPEYDNQPFNPVYGSLLFKNKECFYVNSNVIKLPVSTINVDPLNYMHISVRIHDNELTLLKAVTTDPALIGLKYSDTEVVYEEGIVSWDKSNGFVELDFSLLASQRMLADFYYQADALVLNSIDLNPVFSSDIIYNKYYFYLKPNQDSRSIFYHLLDEDNIVLESSDPQLKLEDASGAFNPDTIINSTLSAFKNDYCYGYNNTKHYMELGQVSLKEDYYLDEITRFDVSERSYLKKENFSDALSRQHKILQSRMGYGELGQIVQKNNILLVEAPIELLDTMTQDEVERAVRTNLPATTDILLEFVYPKSKITFDNSVAAEITVNLSWETPGIYYIYRGDNKIDKTNIVETINTSAEEALTFIDSSVESGKKYYYWVRINDYLYGETYGVQAR